MSRPQEVRVPHTRVHSPTLSGTTQTDAYRPLFLPTVLIGDSKLGGISSTISSYESLLLRGYIIDAVLLFRDEYYRNYEYLAPFFTEKSVHVSSVNPPPSRHSDPEEDRAVTENYYASLASPESDDGVLGVLNHLDDCHKRRIDELDSMPRRTLDSVWWPFVQHGLVKQEKDVTVIDSAWSDFFSIYDTGNRRKESSSSSLLQPQLDGSASWWTQAFGHAHPSLTLAAAEAAGRYGHVMFPQSSHLPALKLAERLVKDGPGKGWASRAFFSDNGSTGMEVALKMALRSFCISNGITAEDRTRGNLGIIGLKGSYHGDTIGAMDACQGGVYTCEWHEEKGFWFDSPTVGVRDGKVTVQVPSLISETAKDLPGTTFASLSEAYDVNSRLKSPLAGVYRKHIVSALQRLSETGDICLAALVLEPLVMGAGGMIFVDPLFQRVMVDVVRDPQLTGGSQGSSALPVIFDEVFIGFYRLGFNSACSVLGVNPDISVNAKILTGGLIPLAVTLATEDVFNAFKSSTKTDALLHGHSYTAHPMGCAVANATLDMVDKLEESDFWNEACEQWKAFQGVPNEAPNPLWSMWDPHFLESVSRLPCVREAMALGTVLAFKLEDNDAGYASHLAQNKLQALKESVQSSTLSAAPGGAPFGIHYRTLGNVAYFMTSLNTDRKTVAAVEDRIWSALNTE